MCDVVVSHGIFVFFFFKQKTAYEMRISDWSSDVCSSDLVVDDITLTSLTSYVDSDHHQGIEGDGTYLQILDVNRNDGSIKSLNQELRLANDARSSFRWVVGANYEHSRVREDDEVNYADTTYSYVNDRKSTRLNSSH